MAQTPETLPPMNAAERKRLGWRKFALCAGTVVIATALVFNLKPDGTQFMSAEQWSWFSIRVVVLYLAGNVSADLVKKFMGDKKEGPK